MFLTNLLLVCFDIFLTFLTVPFLLVFLLPLWLYKKFIVFTARIFNPHYIPLKLNDPFMVWDFLMPQNGRHVYSVGVSMRVVGEFPLDRIKKRISNEVLSLKDKSGKNLHNRLFETFVSFGGYAFRMPVPNFDINKQICEKRLGESEDLEAFKARWIEMGYKDGTSPWEVLQIYSAKADETIILMKIHHALADAYSLLHIFNALLDNKVPQIPREAEDSFWTKVGQFFKATRTCLTINYKIFSTSGSLPWKLDSTATPSFVSSTSLYFPDLKVIQRKTGTHYSAISLSIFGGVLSRILNETGSFKQGQSTSTYVQLSFPWPNHPLTKLCNHWTSGCVCVPLQPMPSLSRLRAVDYDYKQFMLTEFDKITKRFIFPLAALAPMRPFKSFFEMTRRTIGLRTIFTSVMAFNDSYYELDGHPVISASPLIGLLGTTPAISGLGFSYKDQLEFSFIATSEVAKDQKTMDNIVKTYFAEEIEKLLDEVNSQKNTQSIV